MTLHQAIDYINSCSFEELKLIHSLAANRFHHLKHLDEYEQDERMKRSLAVGDQVSWSSNKTMDRGKDRIYGIITRLNPKTATVTSRDYGQWRVAYSLLKKEIDFTTGFTNGSTVVEGEVIYDGHKDIDLSSDSGKMILQAMFAKDSKKQNIGNQSNTNKKRKKAKKRKKKKGR